MAALAFVSTLFSLLFGCLACYHGFQGNWEMMAGFVILSSLTKGSE